MNIQIKCSFRCDTDLDKMAEFYAFNPDLFTTNINDYQLERNAVNSSSTIFKGTFTPLQLTCAVRVETMSEIDVEVYKNELYISRLTKHPNVLKMFCSFLHGSQMFYTVFPYSAHKSMDLQCQPFGLPESVVAFVMADILKGLDYLHRSSIIHRLFFKHHLKPIQVLYFVFQCRSVFTHSSLWRFEKLCQVCLDWSEVQQ